MASIVTCAGIAVLAVVVAGSSRTSAVGQAHRTVRLRGTVCIRHDGSIYSPHCIHPMQKPETCDCAGDFHVTEPACRRGEQPAPSTADANHARYAAAAAGSLNYARYKGRRFCAIVPYNVEPGLPAIENGVGMPGTPCCDYPAPH